MGVPHTAAASGSLRERRPGIRRVRLASFGAVALGLLLCGCAAERTDEPPAEAGSRPQPEAGWPESPADHRLPDGVFQIGAPQELSWRGDVQPHWPRGWRLVGRGRFGDPDQPVAWLRFEAPGTAVDELATEALDPLVPLAGDVDLRSVARDNEGRRAVAQLRGQLLRAAADATAGQGQSVVSLTIETRPGVLGAPGS